MQITTHFWFTSILAAVLFPVFGWKVLIFYIGGVLVDTDHYMWFIAKYKKISPLKCYNFYMFESPRQSFKPIIGALHVFHTFEYLTLIAVLAFFNNYIFIYLIGLLGHYLLDLAWHVFTAKRVILNHSIVSWIFKNKIQNL